jgi:hypothetical protein
MIIVFRLFYFCYKGNIKISKLHPSHLQEYYFQKLVNGKIDREGISPQSVKHHYRLIHKVLRDAVNWLFLPRNVAEVVTPPKTKKVEMLTLDNAQVKAFLEITETLYTSCLQKSYLFRNEARRGSSN